MVVVLGALACITLASFSYKEELWVKSPSPVHLLCIFVVGRTFIAATDHPETVRSGDVGLAVLLTVVAVGWAIGQRWLKRN